MVSLFLSPCATLPAMLSYKMQKNVTIIPPALQKLCGSYFCEDGDHTARSQCTSAQPVVNMEFISVLIQTFFLLIPNGDFILHFPLDEK